MSFIIFPGRHLLNTRFQASYLQHVLSRPVQQLEWQDGRSPPFDDPFSQVILAVTSANQANSRYNPIPFYARAIGVDRFARDLQRVRPFRYRIIGIPHYAPTERFASHLLKEIEYQTEGNLRLTPDNCAVLCSTIGVTTLFAALGFSILPAEAGPAAGPVQAATPIQLLQQIVSQGEGWPKGPSIAEAMAPATRQLWLDFPDIPRRVLRLWRDPLLNIDGDLTGSRDYSSYASLMSNGEIIALKFADIRALIVPARSSMKGVATAGYWYLSPERFPTRISLDWRSPGSLSLAARSDRERVNMAKPSFISTNATLRNGYLKTAALTPRCATRPCMNSGRTASRPKPSATIWPRSSARRGRAVA